MSIWFIAGGILFAGALSTLMMPILIKMGHRYGLLDQPGQHKRHKKPTPFLGGVGLFVVCWITVLTFLVVAQDFRVEFAGSLFYIFIGALIILLVGMSDDLSPVTAWTKLGAQIAAGLILHLGGLGAQLLSTPFGSVELGAFSVLVTVIWVVMLTNAINLIDGLDGLAGGVSLIAAVTLLIVGQLYEMGTVLIFVVVLIGFLLPFLYFNRHPARIFLGDSGSMQIGYYFAVFSLMFPFKSYTAAALYVPLLALGVPIMEVSSSFFRRLISGKNIMKADRRHLFHYLALMGFSPRRIVVIFYLLAIGYGMFALAMFFWNRLIVFGFLVVFMVVIFAVFFILLSKIPLRKRVNGSARQ